MTRRGVLASRLLPLLREERCIRDLRIETGFARGSLECFMRAAVRDGLAQVTRVVPATRFGWRDYFILTDKGRAKLEETCSPT